MTFDLWTYLGVRKINFYQLKTSPKCGQVKSELSFITKFSSMGIKSTFSHILFSINLRSFMWEDFLIELGKFNYQLALPLSQEKLSSNYYNLQTVKGKIFCALIVELVVSSSILLRLGGGQENFEIKRFRTQVGYHHFKRSRNDEGGGRERRILNFDMLISRNFFQIFFSVSKIEILYSWEWKLLLVVLTWRVNC